MINGVRQFKLINALGREYDMTRPDALLHSPDGLGWGTERTVERLGMTYIGIREQEIHQSPSGEMVFRTYAEYGRFLSFCQQGGLVLCYKPQNTWYYCECLISIQKSEIEWENNHLICPVQFTLLSYWYERVVAQTAEPPEPVEPNYETVTGDPAVFNARFSYPIKDLSVAIQGSQDLNGYEKPWVGGAGKNLLNPDTSILLNAYITTTGGLASNSANRTAIVPCKPNTVYTYYWDRAVISGNDDSSVVSFSSYPNIGDVGSRMLGNSGAIKAYRVFTTGADDSYLAVKIANINYTDVEKTIYASMLYEGSEQSEFSPYENICPITSYDTVTITQSGSTVNTYEVELTGAGQVYKGTLDVTSGELVVDEVALAIDPRWTWIKSGSYSGGFYATISVNNIPIKARTPLSACSHRAIASSVAGYVVGTAYVDGSLNIRIMSADTTVQEWKDYITAQEQAGTPITIAGQLATPLTYQLTPTQMSNLIGQNSIKADAGEVTVTYRTDARTEYKQYPYQYSYHYGSSSQNVFNIECDLPSYFKLTIFGEATNPSWRLVVNGNIVKSGKVNATFTSNQKLVVNTDPKNVCIDRYNKNGTRIASVYGLSDFTTERLFALPQGSCQLQVMSEDDTQPRVMLEVLKHV